MTPYYTYKSSTEFINGLVFEYIETYSFQRGAEYELQQRTISNEFGKLRSRKSKLKDLTLQEEERLSELEELCGCTQYLLDDSNKFHFSAKKISAFSVGGKFYDIP